MTYYVNLFSPDTYEAFSESGRSISGFRKSQRKVASRVEIGDKLICYMTKLSRWIGVLEVESECFEDDTPIFYPEDDPFVIRFRVEPLAWLDKQSAIPIHEDRVWKELSFTRQHEKGTSSWTSKIRRSLNRLSEEDGEFLEKLILGQKGDGETFPVDEEEYKKLLRHRVRTRDKVVTVSVPEGEELEEESSVEAQVEVRESIGIQALVADIGARMGFRIWIPRRDRSRVFNQWDDEDPPVLDHLPMNYDETTLQTIEEIDVLWLSESGRAIVRAFEVEHTTSIYSGILRMADLLALQPNMDINLHIVAPSSRRDKVFDEIRRPVFSLLERKPLSEICTYLSYESVRELSQIDYLQYLSDAVMDEYAEEAD
jgi:predicted RNA-binding protein